MRWGILADIHGNLEALKAVLTALSKEGIDNYLCVGDIVGYGADPSECISEIKRLNPAMIVGNHDWAAVNLFDADYFNPDAKTAVLWTKQFLSYEDKEFLKSLELVYQKDQITLVHGSLENPEQFEYVLDFSSAKRAFELLHTRLCFVGHTHAPVIFIKEDDRYSYTFQTKFKLRTTQTCIVNAGSVGQPRDEDPRACYVVYDSEREELQIRRVPYDIRKAQEKIIQAGLPQFLAERLSVGR